ncbi:MAG: ComF family protein [Candidatus Brocadiales bacterium]
MTKKTRSLIEISLNKKHIVDHADICCGSPQSPHPYSTFFASLRRHVDTFANLLYPAHCFSCGKSLHNEDREYLCAQCSNGISHITGVRCPRCGMGLGNYALFSQEGCAECKSQGLRFDGAFSAAYYEGAIKELIHRFKYGKQEFLAKPLAKLIVRHFREIDYNRPRIDIVAAVPLHRKKRRERGFNQADLLGRNAGKLLGLEVCLGGLKRTRNTRSQTIQSYFRRRENVRGAFLVKKPEYFKGKDILLVDDVLTSGLTASECAKVLKEAGARKVYVLTVAKSRRITA